MTIIIECPRCHREVARIKAGHDDRAFIAGTVMPEPLRPPPAGRRQGARAEAPGATSPASYVFNVDPRGWEESATHARVRLVCNRRSHRDPKPSRVVTQDALNASYRRLIAQGVERVSWQDLHA